MVSEYPNCFCDIPLGNIVADQIINNDRATPYTCTSLSHFNNATNHTQKITKSLVQSKRSLVILTEVTQDLFFAVSEADTRITFKHIWLFLYGFEDKRKIKNDVKPRPPKVINPAHIYFNSNVFVWQGDLGKGFLWEVYRICTEASIVKKLLLTFKRNYVVQRKFEYIWERRNNLGGCRIKVAYINRPPYMYEKSHNSIAESYGKRQTCFHGGNKTMCGNYAPLLNLLVNQLNFSIQWVNTNDTAFGVLNLTFQEWDGAIGLLDKKKAELAPLWFTMTPSRASFVDFSSPIGNYGSHLYMKRPDREASWSTYYDVFDEKYLLVMIVFFILISTLLCIIFSFCSDTIYPIGLHPRETKLKRNEYT